MPKISEDPRYHFKIWAGPSVEFDESAEIYYVENYNDPCDFGELASDFASAFEAVFDCYSLDNISNYTAPSLHLARQAIELSLKWVSQQTVYAGNTLEFHPETSHDFLKLWDASIPWIKDYVPAIVEDSRLATAQSLTFAFHSIDPSGDLFRFGLSKVVAFEKRKSADRVGFNKTSFRSAFVDSHDFLQHWASIVAWGFLGDEADWNSPTPGGWDPHDFPRIVR